MNIPLKLVFEAIRQAKPADGMPAVWQSGCDSAREYIANNIASRLEERNKDFDREAFIKECETTNLG